MAASCWTVAAFLLVALVGVHGDPCSDCLDSGNHFCATVNQCNFGLCPQPINKALNCPKQPEVVYDETLVREKMIITTSAAFSDYPQTCFTKQMPSMKMHGAVSVLCNDEGPVSDCFAYTAVDTQQQVIVMSFRGTVGNGQMAEEIFSFFRGKKPLFNAGNVFEYFYDGFYFLWNGGLEQQIRRLKYLYPTYELWVNGHSLGASLASVAASHLVLSGIYNASSIKLVTMGQPRTGDYDYAAWHEKTFRYSFRIVHKRDMVPHIPPKEGEDALFHHRTEVWYNNDMKVGDPYNVCLEADGPYCSNTQLDNLWSDHDWYFATNVPEWGRQGCP